MTGVCVGNMDAGKGSMWLVAGLACVLGVLVLLWVPDIMLSMERLRFVMTAFIRLAVLAASLYVILSGRYNDSDQKWAYGVVGAIIGFWLRG